MLSSIPNESTFPVPEKHEVPKAGEKKKSRGPLMTGSITVALVDSGKISGFTPTVRVCHPLGQLQPCKGSRQVVCGEQSGFWPGIEQACPQLVPISFTASCECAVMQR